MDEKLLTIAIPAYNAEIYLRTCIRSFLNFQILPKLDIIVVNDGSKDLTLKITQEYAAQYPQSIRYINKENGGHGSGINVASKIAAGKYFKVVDADDWVVTENLPALLESLSETEADIVLTHFETIDMKTKERCLFKIDGVDYGRIYNPQEFYPMFPSAAKWFSIHSIIYRTEFYRRTGIALSEKIFYEDTEYAVFPFTHAHSIMVIDLILYQYLIGNVEQSVSIQSYTKRVLHLEIVFRRMLAYYQEYRNRSQEVDEFLRLRLTMLLGTYEKVLLIYHPNRRWGRNKVKEIRNELSKVEPLVINRSLKRHRALLLFHHFRVKPKLLEQIYSRIK